MKIINPLKVLWELFGPVNINDTKDPVINNYITKYAKQVQGRSSTNNMLFSTSNYFTGCPAYTGSQNYQTGDMTCSGPVGYPISSGIYCEKPLLSN